VDAPLERLFSMRHEDASTIAHGVAYRATHDGPFRLQEEEIVRGDFVRVEEVVERAARERFCPDGLRVLLRHRDERPR